MDGAARTCDVERFESGRFARSAPITAWAHEGGHLIDPGVIERSIGDDHTEPQ
jgi:hypothetical protein